MKRTRIIWLAALAAAAMTLAAAGCGGTEEADTSEAAVQSAAAETASAAVAQEPAALPFTLPEGFAYNPTYSTAETALYDNGAGIAITYARTESSASYLLSAKNNLATQESTQTAMEAARADALNLEISDFSYNSGDDFIAYTYTMGFVYDDVAEVDYVYTYTTADWNYAVSVNTGRYQADDAKAVAETVAGSFSVE